MYVALGERLKELRLEKGLSLAQLGERVGVTKNAIYTYENGSRYPAYSVLIGLASVFHVSTDYLLGLSQRHSLDVSSLTLQQRDVLHEIASLYTAANAKEKQEP